MAVSRLIGLLAAAALLAACARQPGDARPPRDTVLVLTNPRNGVVAQAVEAIEQHNATPGAQRLQVDLRIVESRAEAASAVRAVLPHAGRLRAVFTPSQTWARVAQLMLPDRPIVFDGIDDPVANCLVDSLRHPGRNASGHMYLLPRTESKMLEVLLDGFPSVRRVVVLVSGDNATPQSCDPDDPVARGEQPPCEAGRHRSGAAVRRLVEADDIDAYAAVRGVQVEYLVLCTPADFARTRAEADDGTGFVIPWHYLFDAHRDALTAALAAARRPAIYPSLRFAEAGGVLALQPVVETGRYRASVMTLMEVLRGRSPADIPVQVPRGFSVVLNAEAAARQGLAPSVGLLRRADRILQ